MLESQRRANKKYNENNKDKVKEICKKYYENNKEKVRKQQREAYFIKKEIKSLMLMLL